MKTIGGYFGLEQPGHGVFPHSNGILLNTGRNALEYILRSFPIIQKIYVPYYTCDVVLEPMKKLNIPYSYYHTDQQFKISESIELRPNEYIIANNYYGIMDTYIHALAQKYGEKLIVDCSQSFFAAPIHGIKAFYSCRKFIGVCDGGVAYCESTLGYNTLEEENSFSHSSHLYIRNTQGAEAGFEEYRRNEKKLYNQPIHRMSRFTRSILDNIDYKYILRQRTDNYAFLSQELWQLNYLRLPETNTFCCPMAYPFKTADSTLRQKLIQSKIFVATYWPNVITEEGFSLEQDMATSIIPLPIDQRYGTDEMKLIVNQIKNAR